MSDSQIRGSQPQDPASLTTGPIAAPARQVALGVKGSSGGSGRAPVVLPMGSSHLTLPEWSPSSGPTAFHVAGDVGGSNLTGMGAAADIAEYPILGMIIILLNAAAYTITTTADDAGSPVGARFSANVEVLIASAAMFVYGTVGGVNMWLPISYMAYEP